MSSIIAASIFALERTAALSLTIAAMAAINCNHFLILSRKYFLIQNGKSRALSTYSLSKSARDDTSSR